METKPKLYIPRTTHSKIMHWVNSSHLEVGGMGMVHYNKDENYFWIGDGYLLDQEVGAATTDIDAEAVGKLEMQVMGQPGNLNWWWHSHVNMSVFWSGTDRETITKYGRNGFMMATVFNKRNEMRSAICYKAQTDFGESIVFVDELETIVYDAVDPVEVEKWTQEFKAKVREKSYAPLRTSYADYDGYAFGDYGQNKWSDFSSLDIKPVDKEDIKPGKALKEVRRALNSKLSKPSLEEFNERQKKMEGAPKYAAYEAAIIGVSVEIYRLADSLFTHQDLTLISNRVIEFEGSYSEFL